MEMQQMLERILAGQAEMKTNNEEMLARLEAKIESNQVKTDVNLEEMKAAVHSMRAWRKETLTCQETTMSCPERTEACQEGKELSPEEMESEVERREVPTEEAAVKSSRTMKKRHRGRRVAAGRRGKPKELTRSDCGSRGLLAAACRKVSRRATVAWRKRNISGKIRTQGSCGPRQALGAARIRMMTLRAKVTRRKKTRTRDEVIRGTLRKRTYGRRRQPNPERKNGTEDPDIRRRMRLETERRLEIDRKIFESAVVKRATGMSNRLRKVKDWVLWRGRPPPKRLKR
jgi:hypothetical protein